jgi:dihydroflavonol-4-reductase
MPRMTTRNKRDKVMVTGATGLLGQNLVNALVASGFEVVALARSREKAARLLAESGATIEIGDMRDVAGFAGALAGCRAVLHTAAYYREYYQPDADPALLERINVDATLELVAAADRAGVEVFIHTSSAGAIGRKPDGSPGDEDTPQHPVAARNHYMKSKVTGHQRLLAYRARSGMRIVEILPGWMWGPRDAAPTNAGRLVLDFLNGKLPLIPPGGTCVVDARDVASAMIAAIERAPDRSRYLVAGEFHTLAEVLSALESATGRRGPRRRAPTWLALAFATVSELWARLRRRPALVTRQAVRLLAAGIAVSSERAARDLAVTFRPFDATIRDTVAYLVGGAASNPR